MATTYERANPGVTEVVVEVMDKWHPGLRDAEVAVDVMTVFASRDKNGDPTGPAIKHGPYPCKAKVRITSLKERAYGHGDAEILLDGDSIDTWSEQELIAILDHELSHLQFTGDRDDLDRPKLKMIPHDRNFGWFDSVAERHGEYAIEVQQAVKMFSDVAARQMYLPGFELEFAEAEAA